VLAKKAGAALILINLSETPYDELMDVIIRELAATAMESILGVADRLRR